jgi:hypothetical protein
MWNFEEMLVTCRPSKQTGTAPAGMESVKNKKGKEIAIMKSLKTTTQKQTKSREFKKSLHSSSFWNILKYGCISIKFYRATDRYKCKSNLSI